ncbi:MAG: DUF5615 family PIN-like protein [Leptolyngbya sp.]|nr:DUF5615 family PIN-like protein [Leptolyngbya sp.]
MKIVIDMNLSPDWVLALTQAGYDAIHWLTIGDPGARDGVIMDWAATHGYVVFTHDLDFSTILATTQASIPSVIQLRSQDILPDTSANPILAALQQLAKELEGGALITVDETRTRARILPIR